MTVQCKFDGSYFVLFFPPTKEEGNPTCIAHIAKAPRANTETKALSKSAIQRTHTKKLNSFTS